MHGLQVVAPFWSWKVPASHLSQMPDSVDAVNVPGSHSVSTSAPVGQKLPAEHTMQSTALVITSRTGLVRRPAGHGSGADDPAAQWCADVHGLQVVAPFWSWKVPASHLSQMPDSLVAVNVPGSHGVSTSEPVGQKLPAEHTMQSSALVVTSRSGLVRRPAGHDSGADDPA